MPQDPDRRHRNQRQHAAVEPAGGVRLRDGPRRQLVEDLVQHRNRQPDPRRSSGCAWLRYPRVGRGRPPIKDAGGIGGPRVS